jgi:hypothetical protein
MEGLFPIDTGLRMATNKAKAKTPGQVRGNELPSASVDYSAKRRLNGAPFSTAKSATDD